MTDDKYKDEIKGKSVATDKIQTGLRLQENVLEKITAISKLEHRSLNAQLEYIVENFIRDCEREHGKFPHQK